MKPLKLSDGTESGTVFFLCNGDNHPMKAFAKKCKDTQVAQKMATILVSVHDVGISAARLLQKLRRLEGGNDSDLYEVRANGCTARAYSFMIDGESAIAVSFIEETTHSGTGKKDVQSAIKKLQKHRPGLEEALRRRKDGAQV